MDVKLYCCYSLDLRRFLYRNGVKYKVVGINPNSGKMFWVFVKDQKLNRLLNDYSRLSVH